jgi:hypothetical protein
MGLGPPNMSATVARFSFPGTRRRAGPWTTNADGLRTRGADVDTVSEGHLFPASGDILSRFALQDVAGLYELHTPLEMRAPEREGETPPDRWVAVVQGRQRVLEVVAAGPWMEGPTGATTWNVAVLQEVSAA